MSDSDTPTIAQIMADPAASYWLKDALRSAQQRDPVDAFNDAELLAAVLAKRAAEALATAVAELQGRGAPGAKT